MRDRCQRWPFFTPTAGRGDNRACRFRCAAVSLLEKLGASNLGVSRGMLKKSPATSSRNSCIIDIILFKDVFFRNETKNCREINGPIFGQARKLDPTGRRWYRAPSNPSRPEPTMATLERDAICTLDCPDTCSLMVTVDEGRIVKVRGSHALPYTEGVICNKVARYSAEFVHGEKRRLWPLRRVGPRGSGQFERIGWDEALDEVHERVKAVVD